MKRIILLLFALVPLCCFSRGLEIRTNFYAEGMWGEWNTYSTYELSVITTGGFVLHKGYDHPSEWQVKVLYLADNNKKNIKARYKNKEWEKIPCSIIFRAKDANLKRLMSLDDFILSEDSEEITYHGEIWIAPYKYKQGMKVFNIFVKQSGVTYGLGVYITRGSIIWK